MISTNVAKFVASFVSSKYEKQQQNWVCSGIALRSCIVTVGKFYSCIRPHLSGFRLFQTEHGTAGVAASEEKGKTKRVLCFVVYIFSVIERSLRLSVRAMELELHNIMTS